MATTDIGAGYEKKMQMRRDCQQVKPSRQLMYELCNKEADRQIPT